MNEGGGERAANTDMLLTIALLVLLIVVVVLIANLIGAINILGSAISHTPM